MNKSLQLASFIRAEAIKMVHGARASHIGGALSMADLLAVVYGEVLRVKTEDPQWPGRFAFDVAHQPQGVGQVVV